VILLVIVPSLQPAVGESVPVMANSDHVEEGSDPGLYNTDPPTSGQHYANGLPAGFYDEDEIGQIGPYPAGYLLHNLEHGYVIFWYNCESLDQASCAQLKEGIRDVMSDAGDLKVIAFPWETIQTPLVITSWGRMLEFESFDASLAGGYVRTNRNKAPEPYAP
jgi:hypothetical protein